MSKPVFAELSENGKKIEIYFRYDDRWTRAMKACRAVFVPKERGGPMWTMPLDFEEARAMSKRVGKENLQLGAALTEWAWREKAKEDMLKQIVDVDDAELGLLPEVLPKLANTLRADQRVGVQFIAYVDNPLVADQPGLGKTLETIGGIFEAGNDEGAHLIIAPLTALESVWETELHRWQNYPVIVAASEGMPRAQRERRLYEAQILIDAGEPVWVIANPAMVMYRKDRNNSEKLVSQYPFLHETPWANVVIDECHKGAIRNPKTVTAKGMFALPVRDDGKRIGLSGTPVGGRPINLWGVLHWLEPARFSSKWRWADRWLEVTDNGFGKEIGDVRPALEEAFQRHLMPYMIRRTKADVLKDLPPKQRIDVWCDMTPKQSKQYAKFAAEAEIKIADEHISATSVLAEYTRLKQFADSEQTVYPDGRLKPTGSSGKLQSLLDHLDELGILDGEGDEQAVVFSQFAEVVGMVADELRKRDVPTLVITGDKKKTGGKRSDIQAQFQAGEARVLVMTTTAGGLSITLDRASYMFMLDETWNPDDQEQAEDRCHRASRIHQVTIYYMRTRGTVEEYIKETTDRKQDVNKAILDRNVRMR